MATPPRDRGGSKAIWIVALGVALLVAAVVVLAGVFGLGAAMVFGGDLAITGGVPIEVPQPPPAPAPPEPAGIVGSRIVSPDARTDVARVQTVLSYSDPAGGAIELKGPGGFRAEWDGKAPFDLGATGEGVYQATITTASGTKHRLERFTVEPKGECAFTFDAAGGEWRGRCE